jgi:hypothetical protein
MNSPCLPSESSTHSAANLVANDCYSTGWHDAIVRCPLFRYSLLRISHNKRAHLLFLCLIIPTIWLPHISRHISGIMLREYRLREPYPCESPSFINDLDLRHPLTSSVKWSASSGSKLWSLIVHHGRSCFCQYSGGRRERNRRGPTWLIGRGRRPPVGLSLRLDLSTDDSHRLDRLDDL